MTQEMANGSDGDRSAVGGAAVTGELIGELIG